MAVWSDYDGSRLIHHAPGRDPPPGSAPTVVSRVEQTGAENTTANFVALAHVRLTNFDRFLNVYGSIGAATNSERPVYGLSISPAQHDLLFITVGVHQLSTSALLPGYTIGQIVPACVGADQVQSTTKTPRLVLALTADVSTIGTSLACMFCTGTNCTKEGSQF
jgi:hypothetical protein